MKVLWVVNIPMPAVVRRHGMGPVSSGGWLDTLASELSSVQLVVVHCSHRYARHERLVEGGVTYHSLPASISEIVGANPGAMLSRLSRIIRQERPDIADIHGTEYAFGQVTPRAGVPVVVTMQGFVSEVWKTARSSLHFSLHRRGRPDLDAIRLKVRAMLREYPFMYLRARSERRVFSLNRFYLGRTEYDKQQMEKTAPPGSRYFFVPRILRAPFYQAEWKRDSHSTKTIFHCGRLTQYKGTDLLVGALSKLRARGVDVKLRIAGDASDRLWFGYLQTLVQRLGLGECVTFLGYQGAEALAEELSKASVYAHTSYVDNSPNSLAEAMCVGAPCVATRVGGIPTVIDDGRDGLLFEPGNEQSLVDVLNRVLSEPQLSIRLGMAARDKSRERHRAEDIAEAMMNVYQTVIDVTAYRNG